MFISTARLENIEQDIANERSSRRTNDLLLQDKTISLEDRIASLEAKLGLKYNPPVTTEPSHSAEGAK